MREDVGLELRQEFEDAVETVEANTVQVRPHFPTDVMEKFHATEADLQNMATRYSGLKINGMADRAGYAVAHAARMELRDARILIDKTRKAETAEAQTYIKTCNAVAKYLTNIIAPTEDALSAEEAAYDAEVEAEKGRKQAEAAAKLQKRIELLQEYGQPFNLAELTLMTDTQFGFLAATAEEGWKAKEALRIETERKAKEFEEAEKQRQLAEIARALEIEAALELSRKAKEEELAEEAKRLAAEREALRKEREAVEAAKAAQAQRERDEVIAKAAADRARAEAEQAAKDEAARKDREALNEKARQEAEAKRAKEIEAAKPDAEKVRALAKTIREIALPKLSTDAGRVTMTEIETQVGKFAKFIESKADTLAPVTLNAAP